MKKIIFAVLGLIMTKNAAAVCAPAPCYGQGCIAAATGWYSEKKDRNDTEMGYFCMSDLADYGDETACKDGDAINVYYNDEFMRAHKCNGTSNEWEIIHTQINSPLAVQLKIYWQKETKTDTAPADEQKLCGHAGWGQDGNWCRTESGKGVWRSGKGEILNLKKTYPNCRGGNAGDHYGGLAHKDDAGNQCWRPGKGDFEEPAAVAEEKSGVDEGGAGGAAKAWGELAKFEFKDDGWQDKDGKGFNWTRFGIDAAGAAVLATGAGVLTNTLIKKSQLKSGYQNIQCVSGSGQAVGFGEVFIVR